MIDLPLPPAARDRRRAGRLGRELGPGGCACRRRGRDGCRDPACAARSSRSPASELRSQCEAPARSLAEAGIELETISGGELDLLQSLEMSGDELRLVSYKGRALAVARDLAGAAASRGAAG